MNLQKLRENEDILKSLIPNGPIKAAPRQFLHECLVCVQIEAISALHPISPFTKDRLLHKNTC
jgi:hypothetical protein